MKVKYSYLVFSLGFPFPEVEQPFQFDDYTDLKTSSLEDQIEASESKHWKEWIGSLQWDALCQNKLLLATWQKTEKPEILDGENEALNSKVLGIFRATWTPL